MQRFCRRFRKGQVIDVDFQKCDLNIITLLNADLDRFIIFIYRFLLFKEVARGGRGERDEIRGIRERCLMAGLGSVPGRTNK